MGRWAVAAFFILMLLHLSSAPCPSHWLLFRSDDTPVATAKRLPGEGEEERDSSGRLWRTVIIGDQEQRIDMQVIRPYLRVVTHGGQSLTTFM